MSTSLDFNYLSTLAKTNPEELERFKAAEIEKIIQNASPRNQKRLRGIQFQVDAKNKIHQDSPMGACIELSKMMHESFETLRQTLNLHLNISDPVDNATKNCETDKSVKTSASVLAFRRKA